MLRIKNVIQLSKNICGFPIAVKYYSQSKLITDKIIKPDLKFTAKKKKIGGVGWCLLLVPVATFGLGTWQIQRKKWKEGLIENLRAKSHQQVIPLPEDLNELNAMEYCPVHVQGHFLHDKELYLGPRSLLVGGDSPNKGSLLSEADGKNSGFLVITPFKLADRDLTILVNRGWVSTKNKDPRRREQGQIKGETELVGLVRLHENRPNFMPLNKPSVKIWFYRDLLSMAEATDSSPVFLDIIKDFDVPGGPTGGQTRVTLRNEHLSYIITWYSLSMLTSFLWYRKFIRRRLPTTANIR